MSEHGSLMLAVAPNGARKQRSDHPALPLNAGELANTAASCRDAGACMIHLHVRDKAMAHTLDPVRYHEATAAIRQAVGQELIIQITSEAVGQYSPEQQIEAVKKTRPEAVSVALREICPDARAESQAAHFFDWMHRERVNPQYILYDQADLDRFNALQARGMIPGDLLTILLVLGRYSANQQSNPDDVADLAAGVLPQCNWWLCAFGASEAACMAQAATLGGHCRVGFENNLLLPGGTTAPDNAALVRAVANSAPAAGRGIASADQARELMGYLG